MAKKRKAVLALNQVNPNQGEPRKGLVCAGFSLEFFQEWTIPKTSISRDDTFILEVRATDGKLYMLNPATVSDRIEVIGKILRKIIASDGNPGWTFDAVFFADRDSGVITG